MVNIYYILFCVFVVVLLITTDLYYRCRQSNRVIHNENSIYYSTHVGTTAVGSIDVIQPRRPVGTSVLLPPVSPSSVSIDHNPSNASVTHIPLFSHRSSGVSSNESSASVTHIHPFSHRSSCVSSNGSVANINAWGIMEV
jgi:hypothetical protein